MEKDEGNAMMEVLDATKNLNLVENEPVKSKAVEREQEEAINETVSYSSTTDNGLNSLGLLIFLIDSTTCTYVLYDTRLNYCSVTSSCFNF